MNKIRLNQISVAASIAGILLCIGGYLFLQTVGRDCVRTKIRRHFVAGTDLRAASQYRWFQAEWLEEASVELAPVVSMRSRAREAAPGIAWVFMNVSCPRTSCECGGTPHIAIQLKEPANIWQVQEALKSITNDSGGNRALIIKELRMAH